MTPQPSPGAGAESGSKLESGSGSESGSKTFQRFVLHLEVTIRTGREADLPRLEWYGLYTPHREIIRSAWERQQRGENLMLVAAAGNCPIGQAWIDLAKKRAERTGVIWALRVFPLFKRRGIGRRLMRAAEEALRRRDFRHAEVGVEKSSSAGRFYERLGYHRAGTLYEEYSYTTPQGVPMTVPVDQVVYRKDLEDCEDRKDLPPEAEEKQHARVTAARRPLDDR
jgi:ribosomal protein S18 acetylase RimI-like enzyme